MDAWEPVLAQLTRLRDSWPNASWSWDARLSTVSASFTKGEEPTVRASAMMAFPRDWTTASIEAAPAEFRALAARTGGLRAGQRLLAGDPTLAPTLFGLWWPWSGGATITLRIGILDLDAATEPLPRIRALFSV